MRKNTGKKDKREVVRCHAPDYLVSFEQENSRDCGDIVDISASGMQIKTVEKMQVGPVSLEFKLPSFAKRRTIPGEVVWVDEKRCLFGIHFWHDLIFRAGPHGSH